MKLGFNARKAKWLSLFVFPLMRESLINSSEEPFDFAPSSRLFPPGPNNFDLQIDAHLLDMSGLEIATSVRI
ncbi:hypothetical protein, partial [Sphingobium sp. 22B]